MDKNIEDEVKMIDAHVQGEPEEEIYHVYNVPGGVVILRQGDIPEDQTATVIESLPKTEPETNIPLTPLPVKTLMPAYATVSTYLFLVLSCLMVQFYFILNPFTVTVTLLEKSQQLSLQGTLQIGRVLSPITISQSATVPTTGKGHQDAANAIGYITFDNGQLNSVFVPAGTVLTSTSGTQVVTDRDANIPASDLTANPPVIGQATVPAHAVTPGSTGNIPAGDINQGCCATAIKVINTAPFHGGQDERDFQTVTKTDITNAATPLKANLTQSINGALTGQLKTNEALVTPSCTTTTTSNHQPGEEAATVKVSVSDTCSGVAYNQDMLQAKVTQLLTTQASIKLGAGYSILENPQVNITQASTQNSKVILSFKAQSAWVYALSSSQQKIIKKLIAGKNTANAMQMLIRLPGIEKASMNFTGFADYTRLPKNLNNIHLLIFYGV